MPDIELDEREWEELEKDFGLFMDMYEFARAEKRQGELPDTDSDNVLERFKRSDYESVRRLRP